MAAAGAVIENNKERKKKSLWTSNSEGEPLTYTVTMDDRLEAYAEETVDAYGGLSRMVNRNDDAVAAVLVAGRAVEFGPVMTAYAGRLEAAGLLEPGRRVENLVVIRVDRR